MDPITFIIKVAIQVGKKLAKKAAAKAVKAKAIKTATKQGAKYFIKSYLQKQIPFYRDAMFLNKVFKNKKIQDRFFRKTDLEIALMKSKDNYFLYKNKNVKQIWEWYLKKTKQQDHQLQKTFFNIQIQKEREFNKAYKAQQKWKEKMMYRSEKEYFNSIPKMIERQMKEREMISKRTMRHLDNALVQISKRENNKNLLSKSDGINDFRDFKMSLSESERKRVEEIINNHNKDNGTQYFFNSSWILYAYWIPMTEIRDYREQTTFKTQSKAINSKTRGFMKIQIDPMKFKSKRNPSLLYVWYNVSYQMFKKIIEDPTGTNFWKVFYGKHRKDRQFITQKSKYFKIYKPKNRKSW